MEPIQFVKPDIEYAELLPLLLVLGGAVVGRRPRGRAAARAPPPAAAGAHRRGARGALVSTVVVGLGLDERAGGAARGLVGAEGSVIVDGPTVYLWGLLLVFALGGVALFAERSLEGGVSAFTARPLRCRAATASATPPPEGSSTPRSTRCAVRRGRHAALPGLGRPPHDVRRPRGALAPALPAVRSGAPSPPAQPGGGDEVLLLGAFSSGFFLYGAALVYG